MSICKIKKFSGATPRTPKKAQKWRGGEGNARKRKEGGGERKGGMGKEGKGNGKGREGRGKKGGESREGEERDGRAGKWKERELGEVCVMVFGGMDAPAYWGPKKAKLNVLGPILS
jgi:hypothetical protein